jgi:hypothetical protein
MLYVGRVVTCRRPIAIALLAVAGGVSGCGGSAKPTSATVRHELVALSYDLQNARDDLFVAPFDMRAQQRTEQRAAEELRITLAASAADVCLAFEDVLADFSDAHNGSQALVNDAGRLARELPFVGRDIVRIRRDVARAGLVSGDRERALAAARAAEAEAARIQRTMDGYVTESAAAAARVAGYATRAKAACKARG